MEPDQPSEEVEERRWKPLSRIQRRVVGVLVEKAKTTPDAYPLTLNALTTGCNQKSNRSPQMNLSTDDVEQALEELRELGAVAEVQSSGRVAKYRHYMYEWLGVHKAEMAVMIELMLRGEQTLGELRGRAARMEPIADIAALRPVVDNLIAKDLVLSLTPPGRGQVVSHNLYQEQELDAVRQRAEVAASAADTPRAPRGAPANQAGLQEVVQQLAELGERLERLESRLDRLEGR